MRALVLENFKSPSLAKFDWHKNPQDHVASNNTHMEIIGALDSLRGNIISHIFKDVSLKWHMNLPRLLVTSYRELVKKLVHQIEENSQRKMSTTSLFSIHLEARYFLS